MATNHERAQRAAERVLMYLDAYVVRHTGQHIAPPMELKSLTIDIQLPIEREFADADGEGERHEQIKRMNSLLESQARFTAACAAMQGRHAAGFPGGHPREEVIAESVKDADALLAELAKGGDK